MKRCECDEPRGCCYDAYGDVSSCGCMERMITHIMIRKEGTSGYRHGIIVDFGIKMSVGCESQIRAHHSRDRCRRKIGIADRRRGTGKEIVGRQYT